MKTQLAVITFAILAASCAPSQNRATAPEASPPSDGEEVASGPAIGVYDSRAIAVAYAGSAAFEEVNKAVHKEYEEAKAAGNAERVAALDAEGKQRQKQMHMMGFSTAPVDDLLKAVEDKLPAIQESAHVEALVSKWDDNRLARYKGAKQVDVTMTLVDAFAPNERQRTSAIEIQKHKPISLKEAERIED